MAEKPALRGDIDSSRVERWNLFLDLNYRALPWPWPGRNLAALTAGDVACLPGAVSDFLRYSPTDGTTDRVHVPASLPGEAPVCQTMLAVYYDDEYLSVAVSATLPDSPVPGLEDCPYEEFAVVLPSECPGRGFYFGMNQAEEHIGCIQVWDNDFPCESKILQPGREELSYWPGGSLEGFYEARLIPGEKSLTAFFRIRRDLPGADLKADRVRLSAGRACYAAGEWVSWGSPIVWSPREDLHGTVWLGDAVPKSAAALERLDLVYNPLTGSAVVEGRWSGVDEKTIKPFTLGAYAGYADKAVVALNNIEKTVSLADVTQVDFDIPDGWNRLEIMSAPNPVLELCFQKVSGSLLQPLDFAGALMPGPEELRDAFEHWHEKHDKNCIAPGIWGTKRKNKATDEPYCLCHRGIFNIEPYLVAEPCFGHKDIYDLRIRETCERMLREQNPEGWFPCHCSANRGEPKLGDGGAFTNGSVGEGLVLASTLLGESAWFAASKRAADYSWYQWENNQNYAAFALWHLAALFEVDKDPRWLEKAVYLARYFVVRDIGLSGAQGGHNFFTGYADITLKGLARLLAVLPADHEFCGLLKDKTIRFANQILSRQQPDGLFAGRNRKYLGYKCLASGLFFVAEALPDQAERLAPALAAMTRAAVNDGVDPKRQTGYDKGLTIALAARFQMKNASH